MKRSPGSGMHWPGLSRTRSPLHGVIAAIRLLMLTGARLSEIRTLRWDEVDLERRALRLRDSKTGKKTIHLSEAAIKVLETLPRVPDNPHAICGNRKGACLVYLQKPWRRIRTMAGLPNVRIHDLRHSFASVAAAQGLSLPIIGALLGHSQPATTARYAHLADNPSRTPGRARKGNVAGLLLLACIYMLKNQLYPTSRAAELLGLSPSFLCKLRCTGGGPPFVKIGRTVRCQIAIQPSIKIRATDKEFMLPFLAPGGTNLVQ